MDIFLILYLLRRVASEWGLSVKDPCDDIGSEEAMRALLEAAGFGSVTVGVQDEPLEV